MDGAAINQTLELVAPEVNDALVSHGLTDLLSDLLLAMSKQKDRQIRTDLIGVPADDLQERKAEEAAKGSLRD